MNRIYVDCEFNGFGGDLISMALVADDGREWYAVLPEPSVWNSWCWENVATVVSAVQPTIWARSMEEFRVSMFNWLEAYDNPTIVAGWYTDLVYFFSVFGGRDHTESMAYQCSAELRTDIAEIHADVPHNALSDARAIKQACEALA